MNGHAIPPSLCQTDLLRNSRYALLYARKLIDPGAHHQDWSRDKIAIFLYPQFTMMTAKNNQILQASRDKSSAPPLSRVLPEDGSGCTLGPVLFP